MMKKTVSIILMVALMLTSVSFTAFAEDNTSKPPESPLSEPVIKPVELRSEFRYREAFDRFMLEKYDEDERGLVTYYNELYYHEDENGDTDWALIMISNKEAYGPWSFSIVGQRLVCVMYGGFPFSTFTAVYDVKKDKFISMSNFYTEYSRHYNLDDYEGLEEAYNMYGLNEGRVAGLLGDLDKDNDITMADVTIMQRCLAGMWSFNKEDSIINQSDGTGYYTTRVQFFSDFNCDGERDIVDATAIQRYLAELPFKRYSGHIY